MMNSTKDGAVRSVAVGIFCKTPAAGFSKTRLSPPLEPEDCSAISACFIRDLASTIHSLGGNVAPYAVYTPAGTEPALRALLPPSFRLLLQCDGEFGTRLSHAVSSLLQAGHAGAILVNADSPTLPAPILQAAVDALLTEDAVVLSRRGGGMRESSSISGRRSYSLLRRVRMMVSDSITESILRFRSDPKSAFFEVTSYSADTT
jgi:glycosyltransferase A (GT-A) superfamily protein (DUF2064 family)